ncbi:unnamed protein product [Sphagnum troendelagicum]|uniref:Uncharacterized protein n=2 Tax=Sphagnum TaxID=13804 RepID=A0ABP0UQF9_9BRYO
MPMSWMQALVTYHKALKQNPESAEVAGKVNRSTVIFSSLLKFVDLQNHCQSGACRSGAYYLSRLVEHLGHLP